MAIARSASAVCRCPAQAHIVHVGDAQIHHAGACAQRAALLVCRLVAETQGAPPGQEPADRPALVTFVAGCDAAVQRLQADFQPISSRIGQVSEPYEWAALQDATSRMSLTHLLVLSSLPCCSEATGASQACMSTWEL